MDAARWLDRLSAHDRTLLDRWAIDGETAALIRRGWLVVTQLGSATFTIGSVLAPLLVHAWPRAASWRAGWALAVSHLAVQALKRRVNRERPATTPVIDCPDQFSFPSGHATASLAIAATYALFFPTFAGPLLALGLLAGWSRVALGVHYPGDVLAGQLLAAASVIGVQLLR